MNDNRRKPIDPVAPEDACPNCGERERDELAWIDDEIVQCKRGSTAYRPGAVRDVQNDATR